VFLQLLFVTPVYGAHPLLGTFSPRTEPLHSWLLPSRHPEQGDVPARLEAGTLRGEENHFRGLIEREIHLQTQNAEWKPANKCCQLEAGQTDKAETKLRVKCFGC